MRGIIFKVKANYGHFKIPQTNNNPCTFSYMHKVAIMGFLGAVIGIERALMEILYPQLCEDLICSIKILNPVIKEPHAFTKRTAVEKNFFKQSQRFCEYLKEPSFEITLGLKNERSRDQFETFCKMIKEDESVYPTYFGTVNCPAYFEYVKDVSISEEQTGTFQTDSILSGDHTLEDRDFISERVPTNQPKKMFYSDWILTICIEGTVSTSGPYRLIDNSKAAWFI
jgi:CRISPR-associated protein Cas5h